MKQKGKERNNNKSGVFVFFQKIKIVVHYLVFDYTFFLAVIKAVIAGKIFLDTQTGIQTYTSNYNYGLIFVFFKYGLIYHHSSRTWKQQRHIHRLKKWY